MINKENLKNFKQLKLLESNDSSIEQYRETFADNYIYENILEKDPIVIEGRRGMGKTYMLKLIEEDFDRMIKNKNLAIYININEFNEINGIDEQFLSAFLELLVKKIERKIKKLDIIKDIFKFNIFKRKDLQKKFKSCKEKIDNEFKGRHRNVLGQNYVQESKCTLDNNAQFSLNLKGNKAGLKSSNENHETVQKKISLETKDILLLIKDLLDLINIKKCTLLIDEWSDIPLNIQPKFLKYLKNFKIQSDGVFNFKIAAITDIIKYKSDEYNIQRGDDITIIEMDKLFIIEKKNEKDKVKKFFLNLLTKHSKLSEETVVALFKDDKIFELLIKCSGGIPREFIKIFNTALDNVVNKETEKIDFEDIEYAAKNKSEELVDSELLKNIKVFVKKNKSIYFLIEPRERKNKDFIELFHNKRLNIIDNLEHNGITYFIISLDYGLYFAISRKGKNDLGYEIDFEKISRENNFNEVSEEVKLHRQHIKSRIFTRK